MAEVWQCEAFEATLIREFGNVGIATWASKLGLTKRQMKNLLVRPRNVRIKPHRTEIEMLCDKLGVDASQEGWVEEDPSYVDTRYFEEKRRLLCIGPTGDLRKRYESNDPDAIRVFLQRFSEYCARGDVYLTIQGQQFTITKNGIECFILDRGGDHTYREAAEEMGMRFSVSKRVRRMKRPMREYWLK